MTPPKIYHIEDWEEQSWFSTGGTRAKKYIVSPEGKYYYFKRSQSKPATDTKPGKDFTYEFWSEIIAYQLGHLLGFNILRYDIAIDRDKGTGRYIAGCISESMISSDKQELIEGIKYLQGYDPNFQPESNINRKTYSFQLIESAFDKYLLGAFKTTFLETLVFDAIIGNGDRHQENWAIIKEFSLPEFKPKPTNQRKRGRGHRPANTIRKYLERILSGNERDMYFTYGKRVAPIYDSGSSLGRELTKEKVNLLLDNNEELSKYITKGLSEIHWGGKKVNHFTLLKNLIDSPYRESVVKVIKRVVKLYNIEKLTEIIKNIDVLLPDYVSQYQLPNERKILIIKIITLRTEMLKEISR